MCLSPQTILNPTKYVSIHYKDRFLLQVPCGKCADCQSQLSQAWLFRSYYEFIECFEKNPNNYVYFDTLTYTEENLPHLDEVLPQLPHYPCFRPKDITDFMKRLRISIDRSKYNADIRYFISSEYGSLKGRPHMHLLFFVDGELPPLVLSQMVADNWKLGRTDGVPFQSALYVMQHNVIKKTTIANILSAANYVTKYVQKDCQYQKILDSRISKSMEILSSGEYPYAPSNSVKYKRIRQKIKRCVNQFHRQSLHFGERALRDIDLNQLFADGGLIMPSREKVKVVVSLPTYYKRKLFYDLIKVNGAPMWQLNELGKKYKDARKNILLDDLSARLESACIAIGRNYDTRHLADYILNERGRYLGATGEESTLTERFDQLTHYPYLTLTDKENVGIGISLQYVGNCKQGYTPLVDFIKPAQFIANHVILNQEYENQITDIYKYLSVIDADKQSAYELKQRLTDLYKSISKV